MRATLSNKFRKVEQNPLEIAAQRTYKGRGLNGAGPGIISVRAGVTSYLTFFHNLISAPSLFMMANPNATILY